MPRSCSALLTSSSVGSRSGRGTGSLSSRSSAIASPMCTCTVVWHLGITAWLCAGPHHCDGDRRGGCKRAKLAPARCGLLPHQPGDDQNRRLGRVGGQLGEGGRPSTFKKKRVPRL